MTDIAQWPGKPIAPDGQDLVKATTTILVEPGLLPQAGVEPSPRFRDPSQSPSHQSRLTLLSRHWAYAISALSGVTTLSGVIAAFNAQDLAIRLVVLGGIALVLAAATIAVALVITADVRCRSVAS